MKTTILSMILVMAGLCNLQLQAAPGNRTGFPNNHNEKALEGLLDSSRLWNWTVATSAYDALASGAFYTYNGIDRVTNVLNDIYNSGMWKNYYQNNYTYNGNNYLATDIQQQWSGTAWTNYMQFSYTYDGNNNLVSEVQQFWSSGAWANNTRSTYHYNGSNMRVSGLLESWVSNAWTPTDSSVFTYDANNNIINVLDLNWSGTAWVNSTNFVYTYDAHNNQLTALVQTWNVTWKSESEDYYTYDGSNRLTVDLTKTWLNGVPSNSQNLTFRYDAANNRISEINQQYLANAWTNQDSVHFYYHEVTAPAGVNNVALDAHVLVYPNPARSVINVAYNSNSAAPVVATLFDMKGSIILTQPVNSGLTQISTTNLAAGMYQMVLTDDKGNRAVKRVVVE